MMLIAQRSKSKVLDRPRSVLRIALIQAVLLASAAAPVPLRADPYDGLRDLAATVQRRIDERKRAREAEWTRMKVLGWVGLAIFVVSALKSKSKRKG